MAQQGVGNGGGRVQAKAKPKSAVSGLKSPLGINSLFTKPAASAPQMTSYQSIAEEPVSSGGGGGGGGYSDGGGGGGASAAVAAPVPQRMSLQDYIANDFTRRQEEEAANRRMTDFDADTMRQRQFVEQDQTMKRNELGRDLGQAGIENAETMAGRGLLRSGGTFLNQDKINQQGVEKEANIADLLTKFISDRGQGRLSQEAANRQAMNERLANITNQYNTGTVGFI